MNFLYQQSPSWPVTHISLILPRTGVCLEPAGRRGISRLMARMMFLGAAGLGSGEFNTRLERLGASMGYSLATDRFVFRMSCLSENLPAALELFKMALTRPNFDRKEFGRLKGEVISNWIAEREESKQLRAQEAYIQQLYGGAPTGFLPDGSLEGLEACTLEEVVERFGRLRSGSEPIAACLSGLPRDDVRGLVTDNIELPQAAANGSYPWDSFEPEGVLARRVVIIPDEGTNTDELICGAFTAREVDKDWHIHKLITFIFGGDMNSRLFKRIRGERGLSYGASCWFETSLGRCPPDRISPFSFYTFPAAEHTAEALPLLISLYEELVENGVEEEELSLAQQALINSHPFLRDVPQKLLSIQVREALHGITTDDDETNREKMSGVTTEEVLRVLRAAHHPERLQMVLLGDAGRLEPLARAIGGVESLEVLSPQRPGAGRGSAP